MLPVAQPLPTEERAMEYLRRMQMERPVLFWVVLLVAFIVGFQLLIFLAWLILGPFGVPSWMPLVVVLGVLVVIARRQQR
jgi:fatty acid desaturase